MKQPDLSVISRTVAISLPHRVFFTDGAFAPGNDVMAAALRGNEVDGRKRKVLVVAEAALLRGQPELAAQLTAWFAARSDEWDLVGEPMALEGGEACKNDWTLVGKIWEAIEQAGIDRHSFVVAMGGGALLDLVGFAAATAHRGVRHVRMPSTTLSQGDGGVGVKNGVNWFGKKNWVGSFAVPWAVVNDHAFLRSLPEAGRRDGIIEAIKVALIRDREFFGELEAHADLLGSLDDGMLRRLIRRSAELHVEHICGGGDPFELGSARPLDFGHWVAHRIEPMTGYALSHGKAVAIGMAVDLLYAVEKGILARAEAMRILSVIRRAGFQLWHETLGRREADGKLSILRGLEDFREHLGGELTITLVTSPGSAVEVHQMDPAAVVAAVTALAAMPR